MTPLNSDIFKRYQCDDYPFGWGHCSGLAQCWCRPHWGRIDGGEIPRRDVKMVGTAHARRANRAGGGHRIHRVTENPSFSRTGPLCTKIEPEPLFDAIPQVIVVSSSETMCME